MNSCGAHMGQHHRQLRGHDAPDVEVGKRFFDGAVQLAGETKQVLGVPSEVIPRNIHRGYPRGISVAQMLSFWGRGGGIDSA